ncbi:hypothetical protein ACKKBG_A16005 [Auxenochlorella protothecoides x Auxenochlorella symbiontica]
MNGTGKPPGRSRPTNNQLLYKAHFRWKHYTSPLPVTQELPSGTEACASVTSAFLQVLATIADVERVRLDKPRNVLHILSTNTRRTKVVELSSGTHRVADELRRHSLSDGDGGQYSTNLDRNRYGSDNNYLFTVTRFNLECLGLCPCLVDIEIMDTRNGNEVQLVTAGHAACACDSPARKERADASYCADSGAGARAPGSPARRSPSHGNGAGLRRVSSASALRRPPSVNRELSRGGGNSQGGGSELFDALLVAAATGAEGGARPPGGGDAPVTSRHRAPGGGGGAAAPGASADGAGPGGAMRQRSRIVWNASFNEVDSLHNAIEAFRGGGGPAGGTDDEAARRGAGAAASRRMPRRNSVSMIVENPVLAQTGAGGDSMLLGGFPPLYNAMGGGGGEPERAHSVRSGEGDTEGGEAGGGGGGPGAAPGDDHSSFRRGLLRHWAAASAANLSRLATPAEVRRLGEELRCAQGECAALEGLAEELRVREGLARDVAAAAEAAAAAAQAELRASQAIIRRLRHKLLSGNAGGGAARETTGDAAEGTARGEAAERPAGGEAAEGPARSSEPPGAAPTDATAPTHRPGSADGDDADTVDDDALIDPATFPPEFISAEAELAATQAQLDAALAALRRVGAERAGLEARLRSLGGAGGAGGPHPTLFRAGSVGSAQPSPPPGMLHHHGSGTGGAGFTGSTPHLPLFGTAPLNPYGGMHASAFRPPLSHRTLQKVASMPAIHGLGAGGHGSGSPPEVRAQFAAGGLPAKRMRDSSPIPEASSEESPPRKRSLGQQAGLGARAASTPSPATGESEGVKVKLQPSDAASPIALFAGPSRPPSVGLTGEAPTPPPISPLLPARGP